MGMKGTCRSANRGGCPSYMLPFPYSNCLHFLPAFISQAVNFQPKVAKVNKFLVSFGISLGISETKKGENKDLFYFRGFRGLPVWLSIWGGVRVHWGKVVKALRVTVVLSWCLPSLCPAFVISSAFTFLQCP